MSVSSSLIQLATHGEPQTKVKMTQVQFNPQFVEWMNVQDNQQNPSFDENTDFFKDDSFLNTLALDPELLAQIAANDATSSLTSSPAVSNIHDLYAKSV